MIQCFECSNQAEQNHHVVPKSKGGTRTIPLCEPCHSKVHGFKIGSSHLIKEGLVKARLAGRTLGRPTKDVSGDKKIILELLALGLSYRKIAKKMGYSVGTVQRAAGEHR